MFDVSKRIEKKAAVWTRIERLADGVQMRFPQLSREAAVTKALESEPGKELYAEYCRAAQGY